MTAGFGGARETVGPFPANGSGRGRRFNVLAKSGVLRRDIRPSFAGLQGEAAGQRLDLEIKLVSAGDNCSPRSGYEIYIWHCDAAGLDALYEFGDQNYLRGVAITDGAAARCDHRR